MHRAQLNGRLGRWARAGALIASASVVVAPTLRANPPAAPAAEGGTIKGRLVFDGTPPPVKVVVKKDDPKVKDPVCKQDDIFDKELVVDPATKGVGNAFAYLVKPAGNFKAYEESFLEKNPDVVIDQVGCEFLPYAAVIHKDQKVTFKSSDPVGHNVRFQTFNSGSVNQMLPPNGKMNFAVKKEERRPTQVFCDIHPWMKSYFYVVDHPFAVVTKPDGSFEITGIPAGTQNLAIWQASRGYIAPGMAKGVEVKVKAGETVDLGDIKFK